MVFQQNLISDCDPHTKFLIPSGTNISSTIDAFTIPSPTIKATITALVIDITSGGLATGIATSPDGSMHLADLAVCPGLCLPIGYGVLVFSLGRRAGSH